MKLKDVAQAADLSRKLAGVEDFVFERDKTSEYVKVSTKKRFSNTAIDLNVPYAVVLKAVDEYKRDLVKQLGKLGVVVEDGSSSPKARVSDDTDEDIF